MAQGFTEAAERAVSAWKNNNTVSLKVVNA